MQNKFAENTFYDRRKCKIIIQNLEHNDARITLTRKSSGLCYAHAKASL